MTRRLRHTFVLLCVGLALSAGGVATALGQAAANASRQTTTFKPDQEVEVREGDEWSPATILKREGRKYQSVL